jgi:hypothetical protein
MAQSAAFVLIPAIVGRLKEPANLPTILTFFEFGILTLPEQKVLVLGDPLICVGLFLSNPATLSITFRRIDNPKYNKLGAILLPFFILFAPLFYGRFGGDSCSTGDPAGVGADCPHSLQAPQTHKTAMVDSSQGGTT